jgi:hypothetical protein
MAPAVCPRACLCQITGNPAGCGGGVARRSRRVPGSRPSPGHAARRAGTATCRRRRRAVVRRRSRGLLTDRVHSLQPAVIGPARPANSSVARHAHRTAACRPKRILVDRSIYQGRHHDGSRRAVPGQGSRDVRRTGCLVRARQAVHKATTRHERRPGRLVTALHRPSAVPVPGLDRSPRARLAGSHGPPRSPVPAAAAPAPGRSAC